MRGIGIYGAGGFGTEVLQWWRESYECRRAQGGDWFPQVYFIDDARRGVLMGAEIVSLDQFARMSLPAVIAVGDPQHRAAVASKLRTMNIPLASITHITAVYSALQRGPGTIMCPFTLVSPFAKLGAHCHLNIYSYVAHSAELEDFVTLSPRVAVNGNCRVGCGAYLGTGAVLREGVRVGAGAVIGAGAVVVRDVPPRETWAGVPARLLKKTREGPEE